MFVSEPVRTGFGGGGVYPIIPEMKKFNYKKKKKVSTLLIDPTTQHINFNNNLSGSFYKVCSAYLMKVAHRKPCL